MSNQPVAEYAVSRGKAKSFYPRYKRKEDLQHQTHFCPGCGHGLQYPAHDAVTHQHNLRVAGRPLFGAGFALLGHLVLGLEAAHVLLQFVQIEMQRGNEIGARGRGSGHRPRGEMRRRGRLRKRDRLHHLADETVGHEHHRVTIAVGKVKS